MALPGDEDQTLLLGKQKTVFFKPSYHNWIISAIMLTQTFIFIFAWTFAGLMMHKTIQLPDSTAAWIQNNPSDTNVIVTLVSTILALTGSFLLGKVVQHALVCRLSYRPLHLYTMVEWAKLAQCSVSLNFDKRRLSWTLLSIVWISLLSFLTTAWSSLLAPESVIISYSFQGNETDFLNPSVSYLFQDDAGQAQLSPQFNLTPWTVPFSALYSSSNLGGSLMDAGLAASENIYLVNSNKASFVNIYPTSYVSNISTGGIYPTGSLTALLPISDLSDLGNVNPSYQGLSTTYNATQHGFTANITCRTPTSDDPGITPNLTGTVPINVGGLYWTIDTYSWSTNCSPEIKSSTMGVSVASEVFINEPLDENGLLMTSVCFNQSFTGPSNQSFLILLDSLDNSSYSSFTPEICEVTPLVTTVQATCDQAGIINVIQPSLDQRPLPDPTGSDNTTMLLWLPALTIWAAFVRSQGVASNMMGDNLLSPLIGSTTVERNLVIENYIRGMIEYLGTFMAIISRGGGPTVPFNGTMNVQTFGWTFHLRTYGPSLTTITLVTALTLAAGAFAMMPMDHPDEASKNSKLQVALAQSFNPTATMDVLLASSAGDLARVLSESDCDNRRSPVGGKYGGHDTHGLDTRLGIVLGVTERGRPALRTMDVAAHLDRRGSLLGRDRVWRLGAGDDSSGADVADHDGFIELGDLQARTEHVD